MRSNRNNRQCPTGSGFTWIELLVCISILATLAALILPATRSAKSTARRTQCQTNLRNIGLAVQAYSTAKQGAVPPLTGGFLIAGRMRKHQAPWIVHLLPYLECGNLYDQLQSASADDVPALAEREIEYLICPEHEQPDRGGISYVANAGMIAVSDWSRLNSIRHRAEWYDFPFHENGNDRVDDADRDVAISTGVFWREALESTSPSHRLVTLESISVHDGTSQTVLLAENLQARSYDRTTAEGGWVSDATGDIAFGIAVAGQEVSSRFQVAENTQPTGVGSSAGDVAHALVLSEQPVSQNCLINANRRSAIPGCSPRPSSNHLGTVNMAFADGSCKVISDQIAPDVYARLLSPSGNSYGQSPLQSSDF